MNRRRSIDLLILALGMGVHVPSDRILSVSGGRSHFKPKQMGVCIRCKQPKYSNKPWCSAECCKADRREKADH